MRALYNYYYKPVAAEKNSIAIGAVTQTPHPHESWTNYVSLAEYTPQVYRPVDLDQFFQNYSTALVGKRPTLVSIDGGAIDINVTGFPYNVESNFDLSWTMALVTEKQPVTLYQVGDPVEWGAPDDTDLQSELNVSDMSRRLPVFGKVLRSIICSTLSTGRTARLRAGTILAVVLMGYTPTHFPAGTKVSIFCIVSLSKHLTKLPQLKIAEQLNRHTSSHHLTRTTRQSSPHSTPRDNALSMLRYVNSSITSNPSSRSRFMLTDMVCSSGLWVSRSCILRGMEVWQVMTIFASWLTAHSLRTGQFSTRCFPVSAIPH